MQYLYFSATFTEQVKEYIRRNLDSEPIEMVVSDRELVVTEVNQCYIVCPTEQDKVSHSKNLFSLFFSFVYCLIV